MNEKKKKIKVIFQAWLILLEERKALNAQIGDLIGEAAALSRKKKPIVRKSFSFLKKLNEDGNDELQEINSLFDETKNED